jgi:uncharacterized protein DUF4440
LELDSGAFIEGRSAHRREPMRRSTGLLVAAVTGVLCTSTVSIHAQQGQWASPDEPTVKAMVAMEKMWADGNCGPQPGLKDVIADDFQGTATDGGRYGKAKATATDLNAPDRDCRLGEVKIQLFGDFLAIAYGNESSLREEKNGKEWKRCLAWTDTWLKRSGQWRIIAAQDAVVACK